MKDSTDWEVLRGIGQQGSGSEEKQAVFCLAGAVQGELGGEKAAAEHPRVSEKLKNGRRTNVNIHRIMRIVWENGAEKILERRGRNS